MKMEGIASEIAKNEVQSLVNFVKGEVQYFCCFSCYAATFNQKKTQLNAKLQDVNEKIERARGVSNVTEEAQQWALEARSLIDSDTRKEKCFNDLCLNCWRQYQKGKGLAEKSQQIDDLLGRCNFDIRAGAADLPGIKYYSLPNFMHFESRESKFQDLKKALEDKDCNMIVLQGFGGTGKTSMAIQVGDELEGSKKFDKVIFLVVSQPPNFKKIRFDLAKHLDLKLKEGKEEEHSEKIWSRISNMKQKLLIILDDVWEELDLKHDLGIPSNHQHKGCSVLITTRNSHVYTSMGCQNMIQIQTLSHKDALNLFLAHASITNTSHGLGGVAEKIVKRCGGVPVGIVALARALKNRPLDFWKRASETLEKHDANRSLTEAYKCLKLSYDYLKNEESREMFLISSLFPEDFEIPKQLLSKIAVGLGLFGEVERYHSVQSKAHEAIQDLIDSSLFLTTNNEECVKIHDLVREVALWIGEKEIQWVTNFETRIKENLRYVSWKNEGFPSKFDGKKMDILMIFLSGSKDLKVPYTFFEQMKRLKVLYLSSDNEQISAPTLLHSLQSLKDIRTLNLLNLNLGDISLVGNLPRLESLSLYDCSIIELPKEILQLEKLVLLEVERCKIKMNNPFEVIEICLHLEELSFVENELDRGKTCVVAENLCPHPSLQKYKICEWNFDIISKRYGFISRWFSPNDLPSLITEVTFKQFVRMAEFLKLGEYKETGWKNLVPDIVPVEDGGMSDLIVLHLYSWPDIKCLIDGKKYGNDVTAFSKLVELNLDRMHNIEDLYQGCLPSSFLEQLEIMSLNGCNKLKNIFIDRKLSPCHLRVMQLIDCPKWTSIFPSVTAQRLAHLEELTIQYCDSLEHILDLGDDNDEKSCELLFPKLKTLVVEGCGRLKVVFPILVSGGLVLSLEKITIRKCEQLSYLFDRFKKEDRNMLPSLKEMELSQVPSFINIFREYHPHNVTTSLSIQRPSSPPVPRKNTAAIIFSWAQMRCLCRKSSEEANVALRKDRVPDHMIHQGSLESTNGFDTSEIITRQLFNFGHIKKLELSKMSSNSESLFTLSMASFILWEVLTIKECDGLKQLITMEANNYNKDKIMSSYPVFPSLDNLEIKNCKDLEFLFPSAVSIRLENLKSLTVYNAPELKYVVGKYHHMEDHSSNQNHNHNVELHFELPALEFICLQDVPKLISVFAINYSFSWPSLKYVTLVNCNNESFTDDLVVCSEGQPINKKSMKEMELSQVPCFFNIFREYHHHEGTTSLSMQRPSSGPVPRKKTAAIIFSWHQMCCFYHKSREETNVALCKDRVMDHTIHQGSLASTYGFNFGHIKKLTFSKMSSNSESLFTLSMASFILWEELTIKECDGLKHLITIEENDYNKDQMMNCRSVLPKLEKLKIIKCKDLEFLFPSAVSVRFENLKSLTVYNAPELKYVVGKYHDVEDHLSNQNHNVELHFELPALEFICLEDVPKLISIFAMNYSVSWPSLKDVTLENRNIEYFTDDLLVCSEGQQNKKCVKELYASVNVMPPIQATRCLSIQSLNNVKKMKFVNFSNSKTLLTLPMASMILWEKLTIERCGQLKCIMADEEDVEALMTDHTPIFPKLKELVILECHALEYLFAAYALRSSTNLKYLSIRNASELKYVFGTSHHENQNIQTCIDFPTLEGLGFLGVPKLISICPRNYYLRGLSLKSFKLQEAPEFDIRSLTSFMVWAFGGQQDYSTNAEEMKMCLGSLDYVYFRESKIEEIFDLTHMDSQKMGKGHEQLTSTIRELWLYDLSELKNICVGPKCILSLNSISQLVIRTCNKLKVIFSNSILKSLPKLLLLKISSCEELTHIIEENGDDNDHLCYEPCFPVLSHLSVECCNKLKYLFPITVSGILPKLRFCYIKESSNLEHVFIRQCETKEKVMMDVLPQIEDLELDKLSSLVSICNEVDFRTLEQSSQVHDCPQFSFYESKIPQVKDGPEFIDPQFQITTEEKISSHTSMGEAKEKQFSTIPPKDWLVGQEGKNKGIMMDTQQSTVGTSNITKDDELVGKEKKNEKTTMNLQRPINGTSKSSKIVEERPQENISTETIHPSSSASKEKIHIPVSPNLDVLSVGGIISKTIEIFELEEEGGLTTNRGQRTDMKAKGSSSGKKHETSLQGDPVFVPSLPTSPKQIPSSVLSKSTHGRNIIHDVESNKQPSHEAGDIIQDYGMTHSSYDTNDASSVPGVQEIVDMMKLEGIEPSMLAEAFNTHPQLRLSSENRSTELLCFSYRVLLNILNLLATKTPFTIIQADKELLEKYINDASVIGFDKDWLESVKIKVFNYDVSEVPRMQQVLEDLGNKLHNKKTELAIVHDQETKTAQSVQMAQKGLEAAQQEHASARMHHSQLLQECQEILEERDQCWKIIAAKFRPFGF